MVSKVNKGTISGKWSSTRILKLFKHDPKKKKNSLYNAESREEIPVSFRMQRGKTKARFWSTSQIPYIGKKFGFLSSPAKQQVITFFTSKGGILKTTMAHETARILALNGIKVIVVGLDIQCSITDILASPSEAETLDDIDETLGLYHLLFEDASINDVIQSTELPTLDFVPETSDLNALEKKLRDTKKRESVFKNKLIRHLQSYEVIIFDNCPSWNLLIENALAATNTVIAPIGCDINTWRSLQTNLNTFWEFYEQMDIHLENFFLVPTLLDNSRLSQQIYGSYLNEFDKYSVEIPIKRATAGQEAMANRISILEYAQSSDVASTYRSLIEFLWSKINTIKQKNQ